MSDPTIQTFCCHHTGNNEDLAVKIMSEFNTTSYNTVCLISSVMGILGSIYQIFPHQNPSSRYILPTTRGRKIIMWLAVADLLAALGVLVRSALWLKYKSIMPTPDDDTSVLFCSITSAWTQYFYTVTWFWTLFYAIDTWLSIKGRDSHPVLYHSLAWGIPAATTSIGLSILYMPNASCHNLTSLSGALLKILPNYFATYIPITTVMIVNPVMYFLSSRDIEMAVALPLAQIIDMSDPTIQTFCCHHTGNNEDLAVKIMSEFNTTSYNTVCLISSVMGILGSIYQIFPHQNPSSRYILPTTRGRKIIMWLAVADLLAALGVLVRSALWLKYKSIMPTPDDDTSVLFCSITSAWTQYFYTVTWFWTLFYAIDTWLSIKGRDSHPVLYHSLAWGIPAATTSIGLSILYMPNASCHNLTSLSGALLKILPNYFATYIPITTVMIVNPVMYFLSSRDIEMAVALPLAQFTSKERRLVDTLRLKFLLINVVFYVCWVPNLINGVMIWTMWFNMPVKAIIAVWYIMAFLNPTQALLNAIVYRKWNYGEKGYTPVLLSKNRKEFDFLDEQSPLLGSEPPRLQFSAIPPPSINNYATL